MKKLGLISALSLGLVLLAGCNTSKPVAITNGEDLVAFYNDMKAMTCTLEDTSDEGTSAITMYFKNGLISQLSKLVTTDGEEYNDHVLARDGMMYGWGDSYGEGGMYLEYEMNMEEELGDFLGDGSTLNCVKGVKDDSVFDKPSDIEFTSMNDLFGSMDEYYEDEYYEDEYYDEENNEVEENNEAVVEENVEEVTE